MWEREIVELCISRIQSSKKKTFRKGIMMSIIWATYKDNSL